MKDYSQSLVDYKIWCLNGEPYLCAAIYDRSIEKHHTQFDMYDLDWNPMRQEVTHVEGRHYKLCLPKPKNWERMLECARILTKGHPQVRMDLYNVDGRIVFGEMTFTARGGFQNNYSEHILLEMGQKIDLDSVTPLYIIK